MGKHTCHAPGCKAPCPLQHLMCGPCWALVTPEHQAEVYRTVKLRGPRVDASWAPWWRAQRRACVDVALARGADPERMAALVERGDATASQLERIGWRETVP